MTTDMGRDMAGDMARELGTVFSWLPTTPDPMSLSLFLWVARFLGRHCFPGLWEIDDE
jgi:hypothetical protein